MKTRIYIKFYLEKEDDLVKSSCCHSLEKKL